VKPGHRNAKDLTNQLSNNTRMFFNIARNGDRFQKMIFVSSGAAYDMRHYIPKMNEEYFDSYVPVDELGFSKYIAAKFIGQMENIVELRLFGVFGKYEDYSIRFISNAICKSLFHLPITIKQNRCFDYLYIDDLMPVIDYFLENRGKYKCYNVTPDEAVELKVLAEIIHNISGKNVPILIAEDGMGIEYSGDNSRLHEEISGIKFTSISDSIHQLYQWYEKNLHLINEKELLFDK
jgi:GDP-L-fucose synthase